MSLINIVWPEEEADYKVVQLNCNQESRILLGTPWKPQEFLHGFLLRKFLNEQRISYESQYGDSSGELIPQLSGEQYEITGMGKARIVPEIKQVEFYGSSGDYRISLNWDQLYQLQKEQPGWRFRFTRPRFF
tara:strand:- start:2304 stop:2699 length:396 start_codon:yes stop_codon:yes gene_type:complete